MHAFRFAHEWHLDAPADAVLALLEDVAAYPRWWRSVEHAHRLGPDEGEVVIRAPLGYRIRIVLTRIPTPDARELRAAIGGDLAGESSWRVRERGPGALVRFDQRVVVASRWLRVVSPLARRVLAWNHARVMRIGERGARALLAPRARS